MTDLLEIKEKIKNIYAKYDIYIIPLFKFIMALCVFSIINGNIGYMGRLDSLPVVLVLSLLCALLPVNAMILLAAVVILLHLYGDTAFVLPFFAKRRCVYPADASLPAFLSGTGSADCRWVKRKSIFGHFVGVRYNRLVLSGWGQTECGGFRQQE